MAYESSSGYSCTEVIGNQADCFYCGLNAFSFDVCTGTVNCVEHSPELHRSKSGASAARNIIPITILVYG